MLIGGRLEIWHVYLLAGPLVDQIFKPLLLEGGPLAGGIGRIVDVGPGRGTGLLFIMIGLLTILVVLIWGYLNPRVRLVEDELPDAVAGPLVVHAAVLGIKD